MLKLLKSPHWHQGEIRASFSLTLTLAQASSTLRGCSWCPSRDVRRTSTTCVGDGEGPGNHRYPGPASPSPSAWALFSEEGHRGRKTCERDHHTSGPTQEDSVSANLRLRLPSPPRNGRWRWGGQGMSWRRGQRLEWAPQAQAIQVEQGNAIEPGSSASEA